MRTKYQNEFGAVTFRLVSDVVDLNTIYGRNLAREIMFDIETAEKIALITENHHIQICPFKTDAGWRCYVVLHASASTVAVAAIENINYVGGNPCDEIQRAARVDSLQIM